MGIAGRAAHLSSHSLVRVATTLLLLAALPSVAVACAPAQPTQPTLPMIVAPTAPTASALTVPHASLSPTSLPSATSELLLDSLIAYTGKRGGTSVVGTVRPDGQLDRTLAVGASPAWSPDGGSIAYECRLAEAEAGGRLADICVMQVDGSGQRVVVTGGIRPAWSPDGRQMLFSGSAIDMGDTWVAEADGSKATKIGAGAGSWSPDGQWLLLIGASGAAPDATLVRPDGSSVRKLGDCWGAVWSPDSTRIACTRWDETHGTLLAVEIADGSSTTLLQVDAPISYPTWLSSEQLAVTMDTSGSSPDGTPDDLFLLDAKTGALTQLTSGIVVSGPFSLSPDRTWLAFGGGQGSSNRIYLVSITGETRVLNAGEELQGPLWQPRPGTE
jgi:Tol biopolymer transport system component